jgi:arginyl-tRNA synthetase
MSAWHFWKKMIARQIGDALGLDIPAEEIVVPPDRTLGDFAFGCFKLAKSMQRSPAEVAQELAGRVILENSDVAKVEAAGPYLNITLRTGDAVHRVVRDIEVGEPLVAVGSVDEPMLFEFANPNTHKEIHVGHLRNIVLGVSLSRMLVEAGYPVHPVSYINDVGSNVGKSLWELVRMHGINVRTFDAKAFEALLEQVPESQRNGNFLGKVYTQATMAVEADEAKKEEVSFVQQKLEEHDPAWEALWRETRRWCLGEMSEIFADLGVRIERQYFESELLDRAHEVVTQLLAKGIAQESEGAVIVDLEAEKLGVAVLRKTDGTLLYAAKDLALAEWKVKEYPHLKKSFVLVDNRQALYFRQLASILEKMGTAVPFGFIGYELVTLKGGAMSSRKGNVVTFQQLRDATLEYARKEVLARHEDWPEGKVVHTAWALAQAGMKFGMLRQDNDKVFVFDLEQALSFEGATGPYCQYAATRLASIVRKAGGVPNRDEALTRGFDHASEKALALKLATFQVVLLQAAKELRPALLANWALDCAQSISDFYHNVPVLEAPEGVREGRLRLAEAARQTLQKCFDLLGIPLPDEM